MKPQRIYIFLSLLPLLTACVVQKVTPTPHIQPVLTAPHQPTNTIQPTSPSPTPDACSKQTIPADSPFLKAITTNPEKLIALASTPLYEEREIYVTDIYGNIIRNITNHSADDGAPKWSPDGQRIAFLSNRNGKISTWCFGVSDDCMYQLFSIKPDGTGLQQITKDWTSQYAWSPDGEQIAFIRAVKSEASPYPNDPFLYEIYLINADGTNQRNLTNYSGFYDSGPSWSPDGSKIAFHSRDIAAHPNSINVIDKNGTELLAYSDIEAYDIIWTADSTSLLFTSQPNEQVSTNNIYKININSLNVEQLTFSSNAHVDHLAISPDGKWLAYQHEQLDGDCDQIRVINLETGQDYFVYDAHDVEKADYRNRGTVTPSYSSFSIESISWTPDGNHIIFNQVVRVEMILREFLETFSVHINGTDLKVFGERSGTYSFQP